MHLKQLQGVRKNLAPKDPGQTQGSKKTTNLHSKGFLPTCVDQSFNEGQVVYRKNTYS